MPYTAIDDLRLALNPGGVQSPANASDLSDDELADAISEAQTEVDARLSGRYTVPFADGAVPAAVALVTRDLAAFEATLRHRGTNPGTIPDDHPVRLRQQRADRLLTALSKGESEAGGKGSAAPVEVANVYDGDLFTMADFDLGAAAYPSWPSPYA